MMRERETALAFPMILHSHPNGKDGLSPIMADFKALGAEVTVLNLQDEYVSVIELCFIFPFQQFIDLPGTLLS